MTLILCSTNGFNQCNFFFIFLFLRRNKINGRDSFYSAIYSSVYTNYICMYSYRFYRQRVSIISKKKKRKKKEREKKIWLASDHFRDQAEPVNWNLTILRLKFNIIIQWEINRIICKKFDYVMRNTKNFVFICMKHSKKPILLYIYI